MRWFKCFICRLSEFIHRVVVMRRDEGYQELEKLVAGRPPGAAIYVVET